MKRITNFLSLALSVFVAILLLTGCAKEETVAPGGAQIDERAVTSGTGIQANSVLIGLSESNEIVKFSSGPPAVELISIPIKGLVDSGEVMLAIDYRPRTRQLYGVSSSSKLYIINTNTGFASVVNTTPFHPPVVGTGVGFDFNPADDRIRIVTDTDQNMRIDPNTGTVVGVDVNITPSPLAISGITYSNAVSGGGTLLGNYTLYDIEMTDGSLFKQNHNAGTVTLVGSLGVNILSEVGFDASRKSNAWAVFNGTSKTGGTGPGQGGSTDDLNLPAYRLWSVDLRTGLATSYGQVRPLKGIAVP